MELHGKRVVVAGAGTMAAQLWVPVFLAKHGSPRIAAGGSVTCFSGIRGARPARGSAITSLVNGALEAFVRALALELAPVRVNAVSPGVVDSGAKVPAGRVGRPEEQAAAALFAMSNPFLTGAVLPVDGGAHFARGLSC